MKETKLGAGYYAAGAFLVVPLAVLVLIFCAGFLLVAWPFVPYIAYFERKKELAAITPHAAHP